MTKDSSAVRVAIITRTKDRPVLLERALKAVDDQTFQDYVHVVLNDGGDPEAFDAAIKRHPNKRRKVIQNTTSVGITPALNQAIQAVDSEFITILDDDDSWHPEKLKTVDDYFKHYPDTQAAVVKMDIVVEDIQDKKIVKKEQYLHPDSGDGEINLYKQCTRNYLSNGAITYRRSLYEALNGYDEQLRTAEDWDFGLRTLLKVDVEFIRSESSLVYYHQRPTQKGTEGNSVHAGVSEQERTINVLRNKYLREELNEGKLGVGYIMNNAVFDLANVVRLEGHINYAEEQTRSSVNAHIDEKARRLYDRQLVQRVKRGVKKILP